MKKTDKYVVEVSNKKRVVLIPSEVSVLRQVLIHDVVPSRVIHDLFDAFTKRKLSSNEKTNRIKRFVETDILVKMTEPIAINGFIQQLAYYKLGERGLQKICELNGESRKECEEDWLRIKEIGIPNTVELATSIVVNDVFLKVYRSDEWIEHARAEKHTLFKDRRAVNDFLIRMNLMPVWFFEDEERVIGLIMNPQHVNVNDLELAFMNTYNQLAADVEKDGKELHLVFTYIDSSLDIIFHRNLGSVTDKVLELKRRMPSYLSWPNNLYVYVFPAARAAEGIYRRIVHQENYGTDDKANLTFFIKDMNLKRFRYVEYQANEIFMREKVEFDELFLLTYQDQQRLVGTISGSEGSIITYQKILSLSRQIPNYATLFEQVSVSLWVQYINRECQREDVLDTIPGVEIWLTNTDTWENRGKYNFRFPSMEKLINKRTSREVDYYPKIYVQDEEDFQEVYVPSMYLRDELYYYYRPLTEMKNKWNHYKVLGRWLWCPRVETEIGRRRFDAVCEIKLTNRFVQCLMIQENKDEDLSDQVKSSLDLLQKEVRENNNICFRNFPQNDMQGVLIILPTTRRMYHYHSKINLSSYDFPIIFLEGRSMEDVLASTFNRTIKVVENNELKEIKEKYLFQWLTENLSHINDDRKS